MKSKNILSPLQIKVLKFLSQEKQIVKNFYWTGGTVLAEFYLHHRLSEDIDLFSEQEIKMSPLNSFMETARRGLGALTLRHETYFGLHTYFLGFPDKKIKLDFNYYTSFALPYFPCHPRA